MDNYITPALQGIGTGAQAVGRGLQTAAPYAENIAGLIAGLPLAAMQIDRSGPFGYLAGRQALLQDPQFRAMAGPFTAGLLETIGSRQPVTSGAEAQRAGMTPEQAAAMGVSVLGPGEQPQMQWQAALPPPNPEKAFALQQAQAAMQMFPQLPPAQQEQVLFGIHPQPVIPPGWNPVRMNTSTGGVTYQAPGIGPGGELTRPTAGGQVIPGLFQTPKGGIVRDPSFKPPGAGGGPPKTEFQLYQQNPEAWRKLQAEKATAAAGKQEAVQAVRDQALSSATKTMIEAAPVLVKRVDRALELLKQVSTGPAASRYQEFMTGTIGAPDETWNRYGEAVDLVQTLLTRMHTGARGAQGMLDHMSRRMQTGVQSAENMRGALDEVRNYALDVESERPQKGKPGPPIPGREPQQPAPVTGPGTTSSGNEFHPD